MLQAIAQPNRQTILRLVWDRELPAGEIAGRLPVTFGAVSQHLRTLSEAGLLEQRREGRHRYYRARKQALGPLAAYLESMWAGKLHTLKHAAEGEEAAKSRKPKHG